MMELVASTVRMRQSRSSGHDGCRQKRVAQPLLEVTLRGRVLVAKHASSLESSFLFEPFRYNVSVSPHSLTTLETRSSGILQSSREVLLKTNVYCTEECKKSLHAQT